MFLAAHGIYLLFLATHADCLHAVVRQRANLQTGRLDVEVTTFQGNAAARPRFRTFRFCPSATIVIDRGDAEGVVLRSVSGTPAPVHPRQPFLSYFSRDMICQRSDNPLSTAVVFQREPGFVEPRALGLTAQFPNGDLHDQIWKDTTPNPRAPEISSSREGELEVVQIRRSNSVARYWLDPRRGCSPVRVREEYDDGAWSESRSVIEKTDGEWFPVLVEYYSSHFRQGAEPTRVVRMRSAAFNRSDHPRSLTPADIGLEPGMDVMSVKDGESSSAKWDGHRPVSHDEFAERLRRGDVREGPSYVAAIRQKLVQDLRDTATPPASLNTVDRISAATIETPWERYVREFIRLYGLDTEQSQKAYLILRECQIRARDEINRREHQLAPLLRETTATEPETDRHRPEHAEMLKPILDILEKELKPRLEKLPTRRQREMAERQSRNAP